MIEVSVGDMPDRTVSRMKIGNMQTITVDRELSQGTYILIMKQYDY